MVYKEGWLLYVEHISNITKLTIWVSKGFKHKTLRTVALDGICVLFTLSQSSSLYQQPHVLGHCPVLNSINNCCLVRQKPLRVRILLYPDTAV